MQNSFEIDFVILSHRFCNLHQPYCTTAIMGYESNIQTDDDENLWPRSWIAEVRRREESPSPDSGTEPTEKTGLETRVIGVDDVFESGVRIYLLSCECLDDGDEVVVRGAIDSHIP